MKSLLRQALILVGMAGGTLSAQTIAGVRVQAPFEFTAGGQKFPAGTYVFRPLTGLRSITVSQENGPAAATVMSVSADRFGAPEHSAVVFYKYGESYFLRRVSVKGYHSPVELPVIGEERRVSRTAQPQEIAFAASH